MIKRLVILLGVLIACGAGADTRVNLKSRHLRVENDPAQGELVVTDLRDGFVWRQKWLGRDPAARQEVLSCSEREVVLQCAMEGRGADGKKALIPFRLTVRVDPDGADLSCVFEYSGTGTCLDASYPYAFFADGPKVCNLYPHAEGLLVPVRKQSPDWIELPGEDFYGGTLSYLMCLGLVDLGTGRGLLTILPDVEAMRLSWREAPVGDQVLAMPQIGFKSNKGRFDRPYHLTWHFSSNGGYVALAKRYRQFFAASGLHRTLREKAEALPALKELGGAPVFWAVARSPAQTTEMADQLKRCGVDRALFAVPVIFAPQAKYPNRQELVDAVRHVRSLGYQTYRYDQYRDAFRSGATDNPHFQLNTSAWPDMIVRKADGKMVQAFGADSGVICPNFFMPLAKQTFDREFAELEYSAAFLDCLGSVTFNMEAECFDPRHPADRYDSRRERTALLAELAKRKKLAGTECGLDYLIPQVHWFEGASTLVRWVNSPTKEGGAGVIDINSRQERSPGELNQRLAKLAIGAEAPDSISLSPRYRVPFYSLCHHDEVMVTWRWEDGMSAPPVYWRRKNLWSVLYGAAPMYRMDAQALKKWEAQIAQTEKFVSRSVRPIAFDEMVSHRFVSEDRLVQETQFSSGAGVVANFSKEARSLADGQVVGAEDYVTFRVEGSRRVYTLSPGNVTAP